ncbi:DTW domain-containing protein [Endozoicomonas numazuensis]|uniref:Uncharacterized protein n=1 Tax=Endozoicomonas numazuensis TaxID=1137799 RepID=A0A081NH51_9GAMM|nr:hypothetical protein [Endozoicomonas numazuensis]KEQ17774.1 hypothetical protein GZ78_08890 [Endozoicomonas numazuensis]
MAMQFFYLLTHAQELSKPINTGQLVKQEIPDSIILGWSRVEHPDNLLKVLNLISLSLIWLFPNLLPYVRKTQSQNILLVEKNTLYSTGLNLTTGLKNVSTKHLSAFSVFVSDPFFAKICV